jgi:hypothetical protein
MATSLNQPQAISQPFAQNGDKNIIPVTNDGTTGAASESLGFPQITSVPVAQGGIPPARKDFNGIFNVLSNQYFYLQNGGSFTFNQDVSDAIGGYPVNAILRYTDNDVSYQVRSLIPNNTYNFVTTPSYIDGVHWEKAFSEDLSNYVSKTGSNTISANNTFSGTNTFSGSTSLSTNTTGVTQAINDASTKIATTQFVQNVAVTKANKDMDNLTSTGQNIANWSNNVTNCITEIPQDIKLELNNGTLTLKAGSKVYVPNGAGVFDAVTISNDENLTGFGSGNTDFFVLYNTTTQNIEGQVVAIAQSGSTQPSTESLWYDTANNYVKYISSGGAVGTQKYSFPIFMCSRNSGTITSIKQTFNGFGYIGSTVFALPGVKGLIPNGRNADGSLKNIEFTIRSVKLCNNTVTVNNMCLVIPNGANSVFDGYNYIASEEKPTSNYTLWYNPTENTCRWKATGDFGNTPCIYIGSLNRDSGKVTSLTPKTAFHAVDYNDFEKAMLKEDWVKVSTVPASPDANKFYYIPEN